MIRLKSQVFSACSDVGWRWSYRRSLGHDNPCSVRLTCRYQTATSPCSF